MAQTHRGSVRGTIYDPNRAVLLRSSKVTNEETGETRSVSSDADGEYAISSLPPGAYRLEAETHPSPIHRGIRLDVNQERRGTSPCKF